MMHQLSKATQQWAGSANMGVITPRSNKKAEKIAFDILGKPANLRSKPTAKQKRIDDELKSQERMKLR